MSDPRSLRTRRTHNLLLIQKILTLRPETSPFTLILDTVEQGAGGLVREFVRNALASKSNIVYVSDNAVHPPTGTTTFINARRKTPETLRQEITSACSDAKKSLLILSPLPPSLLHPSHPLQPPTFNLPTYLLSLLHPTTSLLIVYHTDIPLPPPPQSLSPFPTNPQQPPFHHPHNTYAPTPLTHLAYLATTLLTPHSLPQTLAAHTAARLSNPPPRFGLAEEKSGVLCGMGANAARQRGGGMVLEMQHRRKSGREVGEMFFLSSSPPPPSKSKPSSTSSSSTTSSSAVSTLKERERERELWVGTDRIMLLDDHPLFAVSGEAEGEKEEGVGVRVRAEDLGATFDLGLTEKQRRAREGVVLPYYDAQRKREGEGEGGRILYDMGREDDFDEEEDEI